MARPKTERAIIHANVRKDLADWMKARADSQRRTYTVTLEGILEDARKKVEDAKIKTEGVKK